MKRSRGLSEFIETLIDIGVRTLEESGTRLIRTKAIGAAIGAIRATRTLLFLHYLIQFCVFVCAIGFAAGSYELIRQLLLKSEEGGVQPSALLVMGWGTFLCFGAILAFSLRERLWIKAFGIEQMIEEATERSEKKSESERVLGQGDLDELAKLIDEAVERRLRSS